jgi:hypothetical protein
MTVGLYRMHWPCKDTLTIEQTSRALYSHSATNWSPMRSCRLLFAVQWKTLNERRNWPALERTRCLSVKLRAWKQRLCLCECAFVGTTTTKVYWFSWRESVKTNIFLFSGLSFHTHITGGMAIILKSPILTDFLGPYAVHSTACQHQLTHAQLSLNSRAEQSIVMWMRIYLHMFQKT